MPSPNAPDLSSPPRPSAEPPSPTAGETARLASHVLLPVLLGGVIVRRPTGMRLVERAQWDRRGIGLVRDLRERYGPGPLRVMSRGRRVTLILDPADGKRLLEQTPDPFTPAAREKRSALAEFQPHGVLISGNGRARPDDRTSRGTGPGSANAGDAHDAEGMRAARRRLSEEVLETPKPLHHLSDQLTAVIREEADALLQQASVDGQLDWSGFNAAWWRTVRRIVLGDSAREDHRTTDALAQLRSAANWSLLGPPRPKLRAGFLRRIEAYARNAEPGSLASLLPSGHEQPGVDPSGQLPHWLFAYDAAGMATLRALALLATHPSHAAEAHQEAGQAGGQRRGGAAELPFLRACAQESVRLWPTTPLILRESTRETDWRGRTLPAGTLFALYTPYLHRGEPAGTERDRFAPELWSANGNGWSNSALLPFSSGPAGCPGHNLVLLTASTFLAALLERHTFSLASHPALHPANPLPATLDHFGLRFRTHLR